MAFKNYSSTVTMEPFVPPGDFEVRAQSQGEIESLMEIAEGIPNQYDDLRNHNLDTLRQFAIQ